MADFTIQQRTRENQIVKSYVGNTGDINFPELDGALNGIAIDGAFFWTLGDPEQILTPADLYQIDIATTAPVVKRASLNFGGSGTPFHDADMDDEILWIIYTPLGASARIGRLGRDAQLMGPSVSIGAVVPSGIVMDGEFLWIMFTDPSDGTVTYLQQKARTSRTAYHTIKEFVLNARYGGLAFDGEFFITHPLMPELAGVLTMNLIYIDRAGNVVKTQTGEATTSDYKNGMTFDGEFVYTLKSAITS